MRLTDLSQWPATISNGWFAYDGGNAGKRFVHLWMKYIWHLPMEDWPTRLIILWPKGNQLPNDPFYISVGVCDRVRNISQWSCSVACNLIVPTGLHCLMKIIVIYICRIRFNSLIISFRGISLRLPFDAWGFQVPDHCRSTDISRIIRFHS